MAKKPKPELTTIKIKPETQEELRDFAHGLGTTYDHALRYMLSKLKEPSENAMLAGMRMREDFNSHQEAAE